MRTPFVFRESLLAEFPRWLRGLPGTNTYALIAAVGVQMDKAAYYVSRAYRQWLVNSCCSEVVLLKGKERGLPRYPLDTDETYRARVWSAWDLLRYKGTAKGIELTFELLGYEAEVWDTVRWHGPLPSGSQMWNCIWVYVKVPYAFDIWDNPDDTWDHPDDTWDAEIAELPLISTFKKIILEYKACYCYAEVLVLVDTEGREVYFYFGEEGEK